MLTLDHTKLLAHLLCMCLAKWQTQCNVIENTIPISTRALLLVLENIKNNAKLNNKSPNAAKAKGAKKKCKMESTHSHIPKKACKGLVHWIRRHCV